MVRKTVRTPLAIALGTAFAASSLGGIASAGENPFQIDDVNTAGGYDQLAQANYGEDDGNDGEGTCGEGNCGNDDGNDGEGACGEGSCGNG